MARSLIIVLGAFALMGNSCQTLNERIDGAAKVTGQTRAKAEKLETPESCIAKIDRVVPKVGEKARWTQKRWEIVADNRDRLALDCEQILDGYWKAMEKANG